MAYVANTPTASQLISQSQSIINANFQALAPWGNGYGAFSLQSAAPSFSANTDYMYLLNYATTSTNELWLHKQTTAGLSEVPFTASKMSNNAAASCDNGWGYLPNGLLIKWGTKQATSAAIFSVDVGSISGGPNFSRIFQTYVTPYWQGPVTATPSAVFLAASGSTLAGNFTCFVTNYDATRSYLNYLVIGI